MSKRAGKWTKFWVGGYHLSTLLTGIETNLAHAEQEAGGFTQDMQYLLGRGDSGININGLFSDTTGETHDALSTIASGSAASIITVAYGNNALPAVGDPTSSLQAQKLNYVANPNLDGLVAINAKFKTGLIDQILDNGILLADATVTANGNQASVDNGALTNNGGIGYLHITGLSAGDTITVLIEDSPNDSTWATLITFTLDGTALDAERVAVSGAVDRYVRASYTVTGAAISFPIAVAFKRN